MQISGQALGGARPLTPQAVEGKELLWRNPLRRGGLQPCEAGAAQDQGQKGFSRSSPPTGKKGPGRPRAGQVCHALTGPPAGGRLGAAGGPGGPLTGSHGPSVPAVHSRRAASCGPALPRGRWQDAGRAEGTVWHLDSGGPQWRRWVGPPRSRPGVGEGGLASRWEGVAERGQPGTPYLSLVPSSGWLGWSRSRGGQRVICMSLACTLHIPYAYSSFSIFDF